MRSTAFRYRLNQLLPPPLGRVAMTMCLAISFGSAAFGQHGGGKHGGGQHGRGTGAAGHASTKPIQQQILAKLRFALDAAKKSDAAGFSSIFADDVVVIDENGFTTKQELASSVKQLRLVSYQIEGVRLVTLTDHSWLLACTVTEKGTYNRQRFLTKLHQSSTWTLSKGRLSCHSLHETTAKPLG